MEWRYNPGKNRAKYSELPNDCYARALSNAMDMDYKDAYDLISKYIEQEELNEDYKQSNRKSICKDIIKRVLNDLNWSYENRMTFGKGTSHHICAKELPTKGIIIAQISKGITCIKDGILYDSYDVSRNNTRCCYGIWTKKN